MKADASRALVVLSGGQDSTTCLYWTIDRYGAPNVDTLTFDYGQRHRIELECARQIASHAGVPNTVLPIDTFAALGGDALTDVDVDVQHNLDTSGGLPNTFVPGRNLVFLTFASAYAYRCGIGNIVTGVAQTVGAPACAPPARGRSRALQSRPRRIAHLGQPLNLRPWPMRRALRA